MALLSQMQAWKEQLSVWTPVAVLFIGWCYMGYLIYFNPVKQN